MDQSSVSEASDVRRASVFRFDPGERGGGQQVPLERRQYCPSPGANTQNRIWFQRSVFYFGLVQSVVKRHCLPLDVRMRSYCSDIKDSTCFRVYLATLTVANTVSCSTKTQDDE